MGGALRDELLGRPVVDLDVACREPERAARVFARARGGSAVSPLRAARRLAHRARRREDGRLHAVAERHRGRPCGPGLHAQRDGPSVGGRTSSSIPSAASATSPSARSARSPTAVFETDPLRLLRAVRLEDELGFRLYPESEQLVRRHAALAPRPAGERILGELERLSANGYPPAGGAGPARPSGWVGQSFSTGSASPILPTIGSHARSRSGCATSPSRAVATATRVRCSPPSLRPTIHHLPSTASGERQSPGRSTRWPSWGCRSFVRRSSGPALTIQPHRCSVATSSACRLVPRSGACWS